MATTREDVGCSVVESVFVGAHLLRDGKTEGRTVAAGYNCMVAWEWSSVAAGTA